MYQQLTLIGHLGSEPEMRYTQAGVAVTNFSFAVGESWTGADGQKQEKTLWVKIACWRKLAELASTYLAKGKRALIVGKIEKASYYTNRAGEIVVTIEVTAEEIRFLSPAGEGTARAASSQAAGTTEIQDEDIPF